MPVSEFDREFDRKVAKILNIEIPRAILRAGRPLTIDESRAVAQAVRESVRSGKPLSENEPSTTITESAAGSGEFATGVVEKFAHGAAVFRQKAGRDLTESERSTLFAAVLDASRGGATAPAATSLTEMSNSEFSRHLAESGGLSSVPVAAALPSETPALRLGSLTGRQFAALSLEERDQAFANSLEERADRTAFAGQRRI